VNEIKGRRGRDNRMTTKKGKRKNGSIGGRKQKNSEEKVMKERGSGDVERWIERWNKKKKR